MNGETDLPLFVKATTPLIRKIAEVRRDAAFQIQDLVTETLYAKAESDEKDTNKMLKTLKDMLDGREDCSYEEATDKMDSLVAKEQQELVDQLNKRVDFLKDHQTPLLDFATSKTRFKTPPQKNEPGEKEGEGTKTQNPKGRDPNHKCEPRDPKGNPPPHPWTQRERDLLKPWKRKTKRVRTKGERIFPTPRTPRPTTHWRRKGKVDRPKTKDKGLRAGTAHGPPNAQGVSTREAPTGPRGGDIWDGTRDGDHTQATPRTTTGIPTRAPGVVWPPKGPTGRIPGSTKAPQGEPQGKERGVSREAPTSRTLKPGDALLRERDGTDKRTQKTQGLKNTQYRDNRPPKKDSLPHTTNTNRDDQPEPILENTPPDDVSKVFRNKIVEPLQKEPTIET